jgi:hypothetical protein
MLQKSLAPKHHLLVMPQLPVQFDGVKVRFYIFRNIHLVENEQKLADALLVA